MSFATWRQLALVAFFMGFIGGAAFSELSKTARAAQGSAADGCSGRDCAVSSLSAAGPITAAGITANGAFRSTAGANTSAIVMQPDSYLFLAANRENLGSPSHYIKSNGDNLTISAQSSGGGINLAAPGISISSNDERLDIYGAYPGSLAGARGVRNSSAGAPVMIDDAQGLSIWPGALKTCAGATATNGDDTKAPEGSIMTDSAAGGASSGHVTRVCICTSDGGGTYTWRNLRTGTNGTSTTCAD